jgi:AcrR family transcriptional regulator
MEADASRTARVAPGRHQLSRAFIAEHQRERIIRGLASAVNEQGYQSVTVADIVKRARIARNTFYEYFSGKEDCFLAAFDLAAGRALERVNEACGEAEDATAAVAAGLRAFCAYIAEDPELARMCIVEAMAAGPQAMDRFEAAVQEYVPLLRRARELSSAASQLPASIEESVLGGLNWIIYQRLASGESEEISALLPDLVEFALTPYIGPRAAQEAAAAQAAR